MRALVSFLIVTMTAGRLSGAAFASYHRLTLLMVVAVIAGFSLIQAACSIYGFNLLRRVAEPGLALARRLGHALLRALPTRPRHYGLAVLSWLTQRRQRVHQTAVRSADGKMIAGVAILGGLYWATIYAQASEVHPTIAIPMMGLGNTAGFFLAVVAGWQVCLAVAIVMLAVKHRRHLTSVPQRLRPIFST